MRVGELCFVKYGRRQKFIANSDVSFHGNYAVIVLHNTKTDLERRGVVKVIAEVGSRVDPFRLLRALKFGKLSSTKPDEPFFALKNGKPVTRHLLVKHLRSRLGALFPDIPVKEWSGISLRKGGATSAMRAGVTGATI